MLVFFLYSISGHATAHEASKKMSIFLNNLTIQCSLRTHILFSFCLQRFFRSYGYYCKWILVYFDMISSSDFALHNQVAGYCQ